MPPIEWAELEQPWTEPEPTMLLNSPFVLPLDQRSHVVVVGEAPDDVTVEHTGCPLLSYSPHAFGDQGYDCVVAWMLSDGQVVLSHQNEDPEDRSLGDYGTFVLRPGRWDFDVHVHTWTSYFDGPQADYEVAIDEAGVVDDDASTD